MYSVICQNMRVRVCLCVILICNTFEFDLDLFYVSFNRMTQIVSFRTKRGATETQEFIFVYIFVYPLYIITYPGITILTHLLTHLNVGHEREERLRHGPMWYTGIVRDVMCSGCGAALGFQFINDRCGWVGGWVCN